MWLVHVIKTETAKCTHHPVWTFLDLWHFHSLYKNRGKVFLFLFLKIKKIPKVIILNLAYTSTLPWVTLKAPRAFEAL